MPFISSVRGSFGPQGRFGRARGIGAGSTGGTITTVGGYRIHSFTTVGASTFTADGSGTVEYMIIGGGGTSGTRHGGGGGAGGYLAGTIQVTSQSYSLNVGAGAANSTTFPGEFYGTDSTAFGLTAIRGGWGGCYSDSSNGSVYLATSGGSGGGSKYGSGPAAGTSGQGNSGGQGGADVVGGGGGGAGSAGGDLTGGSGIANSILGTSYYWAAGGGGSNWNRANSSGNGGIGGGGGGGGAVGSGGIDGRGSGSGGGSALNNGSNGECNSSNYSYGGNAGANTGSGGGGAGQGATYSWTGRGGTGGSGIIVIRYAI